MEAIRLEELLTGPDVESRGAVLRVAGQGRSPKCLRCPVQRLYTLEMSSLGDQTDVVANGDSHQTPDIERDGTQPPQDEESRPNNRVPRSRQAVAMAARDRLMDQAVHGHDFVR